MKSGRHIALFGSSFNPPHLGHLAVIRELVKRELFDEIWLVPVYQHPFRKNLSDFTARLAMTELLLTEVNNECVKLCLIEAELKNNPSYTFDTVTALKTKFPHYQFSLIIGSDVQKDLPRWHKVEELKNLVSFYFVPRQGYEDSPFPNVSSSDVREKCKLGESLNGLTIPTIEEYLKKNKIYS